jgi:uncharacterized membrane protein YfhO
VPDAARARDGWLVLRVSHDPGWRAADARGAPLRIAPAQVRFLAVEVPAGTERVRLRYTPPGWRAAWTVAGIALAVLALTAVATRARA